MQCLEQEIVLFVSFSSESRKESPALLWKMMLNLFPLKGARGTLMIFLLLSGKFGIGEASLTSHHTHNPVRICTPSTLNVQFHILSLHALHTLPLCPLYLHQRSFSPMHELLYSHQLLTGWDNEVYKRNFLAGKLFLLIIFHMSVHSWTILENWRKEKQQTRSNHSEMGTWMVFHSCLSSLLWLLYTLPLHPLYLHQR